MQGIISTKVHKHEGSEIHKSCASEGRKFTSPEVRSLGLSGAQVQKFISTKLSIRGWEGPEAQKAPRLRRLCGGSGIQPFRDCSGVQKCGVAEVGRFRGLFRSGEGPNFQECGG